MINALYHLMLLRVTLCYWR